jgi:hypothetical protein
MSRVTDLDALRERAIVSSLAGFPILLVFGVAWIVAGIAALGPFVILLLFGSAGAMHFTGCFVDASPHRRRCGCAGARGCNVARVDAVQAGQT